MHFHLENEKCGISNQPLDHVSSNDPAKSSDLRWISHRTESKYQIPVANIWEIRVHGFFYMEISHEIHSNTTWYIYIIIIIVFIYYQIYTYIYIYEFGRIIITWHFTEKTPLSSITQNQCKTKFLHCWLSVCLHFLTWKKAPLSPDPFDFRRTMTKPALRFFRCLCEHQMIWGQKLWRMRGSAFRVYFWIFMYGKKYGKICLATCRWLCVNPNFGNPPPYPNCFQRSAQVLACHPRGHFTGRCYSDGASQG